MTPPLGWRRWLQIQSSNSVRSRAWRHHWCRRDSSAPSQQARGQRLPFFLPLTIGEGAERRDGAGLLGHLLRGTPPALARGRRAFPALHRGDLIRRHRARKTDRSRASPLPCSRPCFPRPFAGLAMPLKAAPSSGTVEWRRTWDADTTPRLQAPHLLRQIDVSRWRPHVSRWFAVYTWFAKMQNEYSRLQGLPTVVLSDLGRSGTSSDVRVLVAFGNSGHGRNGENRREW